MTKGSGVSTIVFGRLGGREYAPKCETSCVGLSCLSHFSWNFNCIDCLLAVLVCLLHNLHALHALDHEVANWSNCYGAGLSGNSTTGLLQTTNIVMQRAPVRANIIVKQPYHFRFNAYQPTHTCTRIKLLKILCKYTVLLLLQC